MSQLESTLNDEIDEFILKLQEAKQSNSHQRKVWMIAKTAREAQDWSMFWDEKLTKWL